MAIEAPRSHSPTSPNGPEITGQPLRHEFMSPSEFIDLTSFIGLVKLSKSSAFDIERGYAGELMAMDDKMIIGPDGKPVLVPQFEIHLGSHLATEERGITFIRELGIARSQVQIRERGPVRTTGAEVSERVAWAEKASVDFYHGNQTLVDSYIDTALSQPSQTVPREELFGGVR